MPLTYKIDKEICIKCGQCKADCPSAAITVEEGVYSITHENCISCGHCGAICPVNAVSCNEEKLSPYSKPEISQDTAFSLMAGKRSVRRYKNDPVPSEILEKILEIGSLTSTATNSMSVRASLFTGDEVKGLTKLLCSRIHSILRKINNPIGRSIIKIAGFKRYSSASIMNSFEEIIKAGISGKGDPLFYKAPAVICLTYPKKDKSFGRTNSALAGQSMMLFAHSQGIESCMIGFAEMAGKGKKGRAYFNIPHDRRIGLIFTLGYGEAKYKQLPKRLKFI